MLYSCQEKNILVNYKTFDVPLTNRISEQNPFSAGFVSCGLFPRRYRARLQRVPHPQHLPVDAGWALRRGGPSLQQDQQRRPERRHPLCGCR